MLRALSGHNDPYRLLAEFLKGLFNGRRDIQYGSNTAALNGVGEECYDSNSCNSSHSPRVTNKRHRDKISP
ncbi:hypothetical protein C5167_047420 [Papaver somniferum]|uniref:Uncharacterized protein n=1 Tax=Papaver somniferum TaxID=3469 RepID=A0A4Y7LKH9_PAPSO|nr:hypothetical protein C5167_047420 [Papaver somniferum]